MKYITIDMFRCKIAEKLNAPHAYDVLNFRGLFVLHTRCLGIKSF